MNAKNKIRLDQLLVERGLAQTRTKAQALIMAGEVVIDGKDSLKPGLQLAPDIQIELKRKSPYVSRGGDKLASVAAELGVDFGGKTVLDVGASTGGFTDYALQHGAAKVVSVDVGTGQLDWRLRNDPRVEAHEQTDIRQFESDIRVDLAIVDVSFVSILKVIGSAASLVKLKGQLVVMVKPQFEVGKAVADKFHGVIDDESIRSGILNQVKAELAENFTIITEADSKVLGPKGNQERFFLLTRR